MLPARPRPKALIAALSFAVTSVVAAITESALLLATRNSMRESGATLGNGSLRSEADELEWAIQVGLVGSMGVMLLVAAGIVITALAKPAGRVLLFIATALSIGWHLTCGGCLFAAPRTSDLSAEIMRHYSMWTYNAAILCGFTAGVAAAIGLICLAQRSVGSYFHGIRQLTPPA